MNDTISPICKFCHEIEIFPCDDVFPCCPFNEKFDKIVRDCAMEIEM
jgi:hypothetical protein